MKLIAFYVVVLSLFGMLLMAGHVNAKTLSCWTDSNNVRHCLDTSTGQIITIIGS